MSEYIVPRTTYVTVFIVLAILTVATALIAFLDLGVFSPIIALTIAIIKATIVVMFFMHLWYSDKLTWIVWGAALFWLGIMFVLSMSDYLTRGWGWY